VDLGGLSLYELAKRTVRASWHDAVFGQGSRLAFYHFLAIFPTLLLVFTVASRVPPGAVPVRDTLLALAQQLLPRDAFFLLRDILNELQQHARPGVTIVPAFGGAVLALGNALWALIVGLNTAYEVQERRPWWKLALTMMGLTVALTLAGSLALCLLVFGTQFGSSSSPRSWASASAVLAGRVLPWVLLSALLLFSFALLYRFAPNLRDHRWRWSTPGAWLALFVWISGTMVVRFYFEHVNNYRRSYGPLNSVVMLLLWLYVANAAVLLGGEMNSEIEKAGAQHDSDGESAKPKEQEGGDRSGS
jgi:membrane protein